MNVTRYLTNESGAVTVDWVVLTAAIIGLGGAVLVSVGDGTTVLADKTSVAIQAVETPFSTISSGSIADFVDRFWDSEATDAQNRNAIIVAMINEAPEGYKFTHHISEQTGFPIYNAWIDGASWGTGVIVGDQTYDRAELAHVDHNYVYDVTFLQDIQG